MNTERSRLPRSGYVSVAAAALLFALSGTAAKFLFAHGMTPFRLIQLRTTLAFVALAGLLAIRSPGRLRIELRDIPYFALLGTAGIGAAQFFYLLAISKIAVAAAILLHYTGPVFVVLYTAVFQRRPVASTTILAMFGTLLGCALVVEAYDLTAVALNSSGIVAGLLAAVAFAAYSLLSERGMRSYDPMVVLVWGLFFAAVLWNVTSPPLSAFFHGYSTREWLVILFVGVVGTVVPFTLYFEGIRRIRPDHASITATLEPISAALFAAMLLGERLRVPQMVGIAVVVVSIVALSRRSNNRRTQVGHS